MDYGWQTPIALYNTAKYYGFSILSFVNKCSSVFLCAAVSQSNKLNKRYINYCITRENFSIVLLVKSLFQKCRWILKGIVCV